MQQNGRNINMEFGSTLAPCEGCGLDFVVIKRVNELTGTVVGRLRLAGTGEPEAAKGRQRALYIYNRCLACGWGMIIGRLKADDDFDRIEEVQAWAPFTVKPHGLIVREVKP